MNTSREPRSFVISVLLVLVVAGVIFGAAFSGMFLFRGQSAEQLVAQRWDKGEKLDVGSGGPAKAPEKIPFEPKWNSTQEMIDTAPEIELVEKKFTPALSMEYTILLPPDVEEAEEPDLAKITDSLGLKIFEGYIDPSDQWKEARRGMYRKLEKIVMDNDNVFVYEYSDPDLGERRYDAAFNVRSGLVDYRIYLRSPSNRESLFTLEECQLAAKVAMSLDIHEPEFASPIDALKFYGLSYQPEDATDPEAITAIRLPSEAASPVVALVEKFPNIESLTFAMSIQKPQAFDMILALPKLKSLWFTTNSEGTLVFDTVLKVKQLETLGVGSYGHLTDAQIDQLPQLANLKQLSLAYTEGNQSDLQALTKMPSLEALEIIFDSEPGPGIATNIAAIPNLKRLKIDGANPMTDALLAGLAGCSNIESLFLDDDRMMFSLDKEEYQSRLTDVALATIASFKNLKQLQINLSEPNEARQGVRFTADGLNQLSHLPLTTLILSQVKQGKPLADAIVPMTKLERLELGGSEVEMEDLKRIAAMKTLKSFSIMNDKKIDSVYDLKEEFPDLKFDAWLREPLKIIQ